MAAATTECTRAMASTLYAEPKYVAWRRSWSAGRSARWVAVGGGDSERECWAKLLEVMDRSGPGSFDSLILPGHADPP